ncbi:uncharacterized protein N7498_002269 [Penicillium cinerascens]|uniref:Uncharacterized protein n=1 Tax=Penicillium cinerascens TaxID=70096 RepID=A0A9W9N9Q3_9EURO|nr:uncharacterized protein N7498_002269 [Penicillium cinerascens]KAJ5215862.1 hypothetical protein N7498_002269 [Penicillium cinerascens]
MPFRSSNPSSSKPCSTPTFEQDRENLFNSLMHQSRLINQQPENYKSVAQYLAKVASEFDQVKKLAELEKHVDKRDVPRCFPVRCDMLKEEMQKLSQGLASKSLPPLLGSLIIEMFATHFGRLTLDGNSSVDSLPQIMERKIGSNQFDWKNRNVIDEEGQRVVRYAHPIFVRLNRAVSDCHCLQCTKRTPIRSKDHTKGKDRVEHTSPKEKCPSRFGRSYMVNEFTGRLR